MSETYTLILRKKNKCKQTLKYALHDEKDRILYAVALLSLLPDLRGF